MTMSPNKQVVEKYLHSLSSGDRATLLSCLTEDAERIEWATGYPTSGVPLRGKAAFNQSIDEPPGGWPLRIETIRMTEENNVVVVECVVRVPMKDGGLLTVRALDVFDLENGKVKRVQAFTAVVNHA